MIIKKIKSTKGISLASLVITIAILLILSNIMIYSIGDNIRIEKLKGMQNDIVNLRDKISSYYAQNGEIPASREYTNTTHLEQAGIISKAVDTGKFFVIELSALENVTLNYGRDFEKVKEKPESESVNQYKDLYIINKASHNIFYVAGIAVGDNTYYTDYTSEDVDSEAVNLRYVNGVRIPEGYNYVEETDKIVIEKDNVKYEWLPITEKMTELPNDVDLNGDQIEEDFIRSANCYQGYYKSKNGVAVVYLGLDNWSPEYDKEGIYKDKNGDTAYIPQGFRVSETPGENTIDDGLVVKDNKENEWIWIEVPKSIYQTDISNENYDQMEQDMKNYVSKDSESEYTDTWHSKEQHGFENETEYNEWKNNMLKSVYEHGGFYIGRYETGTQTKRTSESNNLTGAVIQRDVYPYHYVTCQQAQELAKELKSEGKTTSLMFGIQWDLVLKYIETKRGKDTFNIENLEEWTWTLEYTGDNDNPCSARRMNNTSNHEKYGTTDATQTVGFRLTLY